MAKASDKQIKVTYRIRGELAMSFHRYTSDRGLKKDKSIERLIDFLVHGRLRFPDGGNNL